METGDYYQRLGVAADAATGAIKRAYRDLALRYHPDRNPDDAAVVGKMQAINEAYAVLSNPDKRRQYDRLRRQYGAEAHNRFRSTYSDQDIFGGSDVFQIFEELSRAFGMRGLDELLRDAARPGWHTYGNHRPGMRAGTFVCTGPGGARRRQRPLQTGQGGLGRLALRLLGRGPRKTGADIHDAIRVSPRLASEGGPYAYYSKLRSKKLIVKMPSGIRDGQQLRLAGQGLEARGGRPAGDLYLRVNIQRSLWKRVITALTHRLPRRRG
jgi:curved DNA-binding protein